MHHLLPSRFRRLPVERRKRVARVRLKELPQYQPTVPNARAVCIITVQCKQPTVNA